MLVRYLTLLIFLLLPFSATRAIASEVSTPPKTSVCTYKTATLAVAVNVVGAFCRGYIGRYISGRFVYFCNYVLDKKYKTETVIRGLFILFYILVPIGLLLLDWGWESFKVWVGVQEQVTPILNDNKILGIIQIILPLLMHIIFCLATIRQNKCFYKDEHKVWLEPTVGNMINFCYSCSWAWFGLFGPGCSWQIPKPLRGGVLFSDLLC